MEIVKLVAQRQIKCRRIHSIYQSAYGRYTPE